MAGTGSYQQVFGRHGFDYIIGCEILFGITRYIHDSPVYRVVSLPNGWYGWCIDIKHIIDGRVITPKAWERLERFMRWEYKKKYGRLPSEEELRSVRDELYVSEIMRREAEKAGAMIGEILDYVRSMALIFYLERWWGRAEDSPDTW